MKHRWQERLRELEVRALTEENERMAQADREAKRKFAEMIEAEKLKFVRRTIEAAELITQKALEILRQPSGNCTPDDAAKLFSVGHSIGSAALNLPGQNLMLQGFVGSAAAVINVVVKKDAQSRKVDEIEAEYLAKRPDHPQAERRLREWATWLNGSDDGEEE